MIIAFCSYAEGMTRVSQRPALVLTAEESEYSISCASHVRPAIRDVQRAQILYRYHASEKLAHIARSLNMTRKSVAEVDR